jgi:hypothetical protein
VARGRRGQRLGRLGLRASWRPRFWRAPGLRADARTALFVGMSLLDDQWSRPQPKAQSRRSLFASVERRCRAASVRSHPLLPSQPEPRRSQLGFEPMPSVQWFLSPTSGPLPRETCAGRLRAQIRDVPGAFAISRGRKPQSPLEATTRRARPDSRQLCRVHTGANNRHDPRLGVCLLLRCNDREGAAPLSRLPNTESSASSSASL